VTREATPLGVYGIRAIAGRRYSEGGGDRRGGEACFGWRARPSTVTGLEGNLRYMRDVLIHDYIGVDLDELWNVASSPSDAPMHENQT
jgi:hypothetical protein